MKPLIGLLLMLNICAVLSAQESVEFDAHEWGTFTTVTRGDGVMLKWRALDGPKDLPDFVHVSPVLLKFAQEETTRMETPVIYFHAQRPLVVNVSVEFPKGLVTEWYPDISESNINKGQVRWAAVHVEPGARPELSMGNGKGHYFAARASDSAPICVRRKDKEEWEDYIFYRGIGSPDLPMEVYASGDTVRVKSNVAEAIKYIVFENNGAAMNYGVYAAFRQKNNIDVPRPLIDGIRWEGLDHKEALERLLLETGLNPDEAKAMITTWSDDWFEPGLRVFWIVPRRTVDQILPLTLQPAPRRLVRAFVGRVEVLTDAFAIRVRDVAPDLIQNQTERVEACGRFARVVLEDLARTTEDLVLKKALRTYLDSERPRSFKLK